MRLNSSFSPVSSHIRQGDLKHYTYIKLKDMTKQAQNTLKVAKEFSVILNNWIPEKLFEVNLRNKEVSYIEHGCCATHDFCDPNQAMINAYKIVFGKEPNPQNKKDNQLINNAWLIAKTAEFKIDCPLYN